MIKTLYMANWKRHHDKTFKFESGLNLIRGENEAGKSLIFEAIDFALHGSVALRLPVSCYPKNLTSQIEVTIGGKDYTIYRTLKGATIHSGDMLIASGTKPVEAEVRKIFGYNRNVFMVSNFSSQDAINYLSSLKPMERKKTIDNVVGLSAVEEIIAECKAELTICNRLVAEHQKKEPSQTLTEPEFPYDPNIPTHLDEIKDNKQLLTAKIADLESIIKQHQNLDATRPLESDMNNIVGVEIPELTQEKMDDYYQKLAVARSEYSRACKDLKDHKDNPVGEPLRPTTDRIIPNLTVQQAIDGHNERQQILTQLQIYEKLVAEGADLSSLVFYTEAEINEVREQQKLYKKWLDVQNLKKSGTIPCPNCKHEVFLQQERLQQLEYVPDHVEKPSLDADQMVQDSRQYTYTKESIERNKKLLSETQDQLADFDQRWYSEIALGLHIEQSNKLKEYTEKSKPAYDAYVEKLNKLEEQFKQSFQQLHDLQTNWYNDDQIQQHEMFIKSKRQHELDLAAINQWQRTKDNLRPLDDVTVEYNEAQVKFAELVDREAYLTVKNDIWVKYLAQEKVHSEWLNEHNELDFAAELESNKIKTLQAFKAKIKSAILPSVNVVASNWMNRMSEGEHTSVTLTDDMDILVDHEPIEALSISGRALGHLSLRMALGQVLTNSVFPVFMADEVDASMRNNRSQNVLNALVDMLNHSVKQLFVISHKDIDAKSHIIEV